MSFESASRQATDDDTHEQEDGDIRMIVRAWRFGETPPEGAREVEAHDAFKKEGLSSFFDARQGLDGSSCFARRQAHRASKKTLFDAMKAKRS